LQWRTIKPFKVGLEFRWPQPQALGRADAQDRRQLRPIPQRHPSRRLGGSASSQRKIGAFVEGVGETAPGRQLAQLPVDSLQANFLDPQASKRRACRRRSTARAAGKKHCAACGTTIGRIGGRPHQPQSA
jgi:hypothetical protein